MHSIKNKDLLLSEQLDNLNINLAVLTEIWLKGMPEDKAWAKPIRANAQQLYSKNSQQA